MSKLFCTSKVHFAECKCVKVLTMILAVALTVTLAGCVNEVSDMQSNENTSPPSQSVSSALPTQTETPQTPVDTQPESSGISDLFDVFVSCARYEQSLTLEDVKSILATSGYEDSDFTQNDENGFIILDSDFKGAWLGGSWTDDGQLDELFYNLNADGDYVSVRFLDERVIYTYQQGDVRVNADSVNELISYATDCLGIFIWD